MKFVEGESIARKVLRDKEYKEALKGLAFQCGESIAKIHQADINNFSFLPKKTVSEQYCSETVFFGKKEKLFISA